MESTQKMIFYLTNQIVAYFINVHMEIQSCFHVPMIWNSTQLLRYPSDFPTVII